MKPSPDNDEKLERLIHRTLRDLPRRRAPGTLESRVLAELERRAALPWWHKSYAYWPLPVRCAFLLGSAGLAKVALMAVVWVLAGVDAMPFADAFAPQIAWLQTGISLFGSARDFFAVILHSIPSLWLYGAAAFVAAMYAALFGLGATAYRVLYANR
jgi:hypothetical protein